MTGSVAPRPRRVASGADVEALVRQVEALGTALGARATTAALNTEAQARQTLAGTVATIPTPSAVPSLRAEYVHGGAGQALTATWATLANDGQGAGTFNEGFSVTWDPATSQILNPEGAVYGARLRLTVDAPKPADTALATNVGLGALNLSLALTISGTNVLRLAEAARFPIVAVGIQFGSGAVWVLGRGDTRPVPWGTGTMLEYTIPAGALNHIPNLPSGARPRVVVRRVDGGAGTVTITGNAVGFTQNTGLKLTPRT